MAAFECRGSSELTSASITTTTAELLALRRHFNHAGCPHRGTTRVIAFRVGRDAGRAVAMPRKGAPAPTDADDRFDDSRHPHRTLASNGKHASVIRGSG